MSLKGPVRHFLTCGSAFGLGAADGVPGCQGKDLFGLCKIIDCCAMVAGGVIIEYLGDLEAKFAVVWDP